MLFRSTIQQLDDNSVIRKLLAVRKGTKSYYYILSASDVHLKCKDKWEDCILAELDWDNIFLKPFKTTVDTKLRWFQFRIIHNILSTNNFLSKIKLADSNLCTFCQCEVETISHLFWYCKHTQAFWKQFMELLNGKCPHIHNMNLDLQLVLFGLRENVKTDDVFDLLLLLAKFFLYKCKVLKNTINFNHYRNYIHDRYIIEKNISFTNSHHDKFYKKWMLYHDVANPK